VKYVLLFVETEQFAKDLDAMDQSDRDRPSCWRASGSWSTPTRRALDGVSRKGCHTRRSGVSHLSAGGVRRWTREVLTVP
jgi:hypothetical protein